MGWAVYLDRFGGVMFWTAFIWGLGVSVGGAVGVLFFVLFFKAMERLLNTKAVKESIDYAEKSLEALQERNDLTVQIIDQLAQISHQLNQGKSETKN